MRIYYANKFDRVFALVVFAANLTWFTFRQYLAVRRKKIYGKKVSGKRIKIFIRISTRFGTVWLNFSLRYFFRISSYFSYYFSDFLWLFFMVKNFSYNFNIGEFLRNSETHFHQVEKKSTCPTISGNFFPEVFFSRIFFSWFYVAGSLAYSKPKK